MTVCNGTAQYIYIMLSPHQAVVMQVYIYFMLSLTRAPPAGARTSLVDLGRSRPKTDDLH